MKQSVGRNIAGLRLACGMTQEQLAKRMGVTPQAVSKWENDLNYPDVATLPALAALLGTSVDALLTVPDGDAPAAATPPSASSPIPSPAAPSPASPPTASSPAAPAATGFSLVRPEPAAQAEGGPRAPRAAGRSLHIEVRGPQDNVNLAFPMQAVSALAALIAHVPQVHSAVGAYGIDLNALLATAFSTLDGVGPSTLIDVIDDDDHVRIWVD
ncbi:DNA-binding protein [Actinomyces sp. 432]|uniref:helix-turn-helix transcriptional regulator n=1 Tax=Actinomyces sp. 432 TaxID=2057798 RepID=UPI001373A153|nr:helix-turn-helix transcriptional regulator [Actinomyces sp. 432]QHO91539.1 DNA-binding protein [Actinomyces sp. 432]